MAQNKKYSLGELASLLDVDLIGDDQCEITGLGALGSAGSGQLSFLSNPKYIDQLSSSKASAVIVESQFADRVASNKLISSQPYVTFAKATALFSSLPETPPGIHSSAIVHATAKVSASATIGPHAVIGARVKIGANSVIMSDCYVGDDSLMGADCRLYSGVKLYHEVRLGDRVTIHSGSVIGADGFGFAFDGEKSVKIHQLGGVQLGDDVEIGAATTIDRGAIDDTIIEQGVKIDNQVQIGHNCHIGEHTVICGDSALAGSVKVGKYCVLGGGSGFVGHISIADKVQISARTLVGKSITEAGMYSSGTGHMKTRDWKRSIVRFEQLDDMAKRLKKLEKQLIDKSQ